MLYTHVTLRAVHANGCTHETTYHLRRRLPRTQHTVLVEVITDKVRQSRDEEALRVQRTPMAKVMASVSVSVSVSVGAKAMLRYSCYCSWGFPLRLQLTAMRTPTRAREIECVSESMACYTARPHNRDVEV